MSRLWIAIWTAGTNDDGRTMGGDPRGFANRVGRRDTDINRNPSFLRCMVERREGCAVVPVICRQIDEYRDDDGAHR